MARAPAWLRLEPRQLTIGFLGLLLLISTGVTLLSAAESLPIPEQMDEGEPLIYALATRVVRGEPLYQSFDHLPYIQAHYMPLYYWAVAGLRVIAGPGFMPGRALSLLAGLLGAACVAYVTRAHARSPWVAGLAVLMFLGLGFPGAPAPFLSLVRVDMLGVGLSLLTVAVLTHGTSRRHVIGAGVLAGLALLTKQSLFAATLAGALWLATSGQSRGMAALYVSVAIATMGIPSVFLQWSSNGAFWANVGLDNPTPTALEFGASLFRELVVTQGVPFLLALLYTLTTRAWRSRGVRLIVLYWLFTMLPVLGIVKVGSNRNYWIELAAASAILASLGVSTLTARRRRLLPALLAWAPMLLFAGQLGVLLPARFATDRSFDVIPPSWSLLAPLFSRLRGEAPSFRQLVKDVSGEPGLVLSESLDVTVLGDHPVELEPFAFSMLEYQHRWNSEPLVDEICAGHVTLLVLSYPLDVDVYPVGLRAFPMWPPSVMTALRHAMRLEQVRDNFYWLYRTAPSRDLSAVNECETAALAARAGPE